MFKGTIATMNELIVNEVMAQINGLSITEWEDGWNWTYKSKGNVTYVKAYFKTPLDAFIDFTKTVLEANDKLTGGDISYDED